VSSMRSSAGASRWTGWVGFAGIFMIVVGGIDFFQGLIAVIRGSYYAVTQNQIIVFDLRSWGWIMMIWGLALMFGGRSLLSGASWGRWFAIVAACLNFIVQLSFVGSAEYPLWSLAGLAVSVLVIFSLTVKWNEVVA